VERGRGQVEVESSGAPGGGVAAVGANDVARFSLCEKSASGLDGGPTTLLTRFAEELRRAPATGGF